MPFDKILIANRGEIACRVLRTCRELGIRTVAVYSQADADAQHVRLADEAWPIGGPQPADSYLRGDAILEVARRTGAQAIHPGYGFLSENADFAEAVEAAGIRFIGPSAASMRKMGSKAGAKELMAAAGVPVVPGYTGEDQDPAQLQAEADRIGYPLMIKAAHGGGGKGMRVVRESAAFAAALESCQREARNAFGRDRVLLERYIEQPRHIEIQVFGDSHGNVIHLGERECSAQRRYQKVLEESPSPFVTPELRARMGEAAVLAARAIDYVNAGTVEFIVAPDGGFWFMEINTRLQVEHPVTECVTGLDLVAWQLQVAAGQALPLAQDEVRHQGHAIEVRLYAEDPEAGFLPGSGHLQRLQLPNGRPSRETPPRPSREPLPRHSRESGNPRTSHTRIDSGVIEGDEVTIFYDPMIAKLIVHDADRPRALARLRDALAQCAITGPKSNISFLEQLVRHPAVTGATIDTGYLDRHLEEFLPSGQAPEPTQVAAAVAAQLLAAEEAARACSAASGDPRSPWVAADGWRLDGPALRPLAFEHEGRRFEVGVRGGSGDYAIQIDGTAHQVEGARLDEDVLSARIDGQGVRLRVLDTGSQLLVHDGDTRLQLFPQPLHQEADAGAGAGADRVLAPMPGRVVVARVAAGDAVEEGQELMVIEAMKMELSLKAPRSGTVAEVRAAAGDFVDADAVLVALEKAVAA